MEHLEPKSAFVPPPPLPRLPVAEPAPLAELLVEELEYEPPPYAPTEDDLPYEDGEPLETQLHVLQIFLLIEALSLYWQDRDDVFVGGNMFVYFSPEQRRDHDFRGPDFFAVQGGVVKRIRKSWVVWQDGKAPDVVIELLSDSTARRDKGAKKQIYQDHLRVPNYYWFDPHSGEFAGFELVGGRYQELPREAQGRLPCPVLNLALVRWEGEFLEATATWLRWAWPDGTLLPTRGEYEKQLADAERPRAAEARQRANAERQRAEAAEQQAQATAELLAKYRARFGELPE